MTNPAKYPVTLSQIVARAWALARMNRQTMNDTHDPDLRAWAQIALREAREGNLAAWTPLDRLDVLKAQLFDLQGRSLRQPVGPQIDAVRDEISQLQSTA